MRLRVCDTLANNATIRPLLSRRERIIATLRTNHSGRRRRLFTATQPSDCHDLSAAKRVYKASLSIFQKEPGRLLLLTRGR